MQTLLDTVATRLGLAVPSPTIGATEFFVAVLVACGLIMIALSSVLSKDGADHLEWWER